MRILRRGKLTWLVDEEELRVFDSMQATLYASWAQPRSALFQKFRQAVLHSRREELGTWIEVLDLASKYKVYGVGAKRPELAESL